jgi:hypothetical protein
VSLYQCLALSTASGSWLLSILKQSKHCFARMLKRDDTSVATGCQVTARVCCTRTQCCVGRVLHCNIAAKLQGKGVDRAFYELRALICQVGGVMGVSLVQVSCLPGTGVRGSDLGSPCAYTGGLIQAFQKHLGVLVYLCC